MADAIGPRVPLVPGRLYGRDRRQTQEQIRQLQRPRVNLPSGGLGVGGVPVGSVQIESTSGTVASSADGSILEWSSVTYRDPDVVAGVGGWVSTSGHLVTVTQSGWYQAAMLLVLEWPTASAPEAVQVYTGGGADAAHQDADEVPTLRNGDGTKKRVWRWFHKVPTYLGAGDSFHAEATLRPAAAAPSTYGKVFWVIARLS